MKKHLRQEMKRRLGAMAPGRIAARSRAAAGLLVAQEEFARARVVMLYLAMAGEADPSQAAVGAWRQGKTVLAPRVDWDRRRMIALEIRPGESDLIVNPYGIREPAGGRAWPAEDIDLIIVPALAYDCSGGRLGRGGGFYDRFLASPGVRAVTCGFALAEQVVDELPVHAHDKRVTMLVTDKEVLRFSGMKQ